MRNRIFSILLVLVTVSPCRAQGGGMKPMLGDLIVEHDPGLVGCWLFNVGGGAIVKDLSGNGITGTLAATHIWVAGKFGPAIYSNGTDIIACGIPKIIYGGTQISASAWVRLSGNIVTGAIQPLMWAGTGFDVFRFTSNTTEDVVFSVNDAATHTENKAIWTDGFLNNPGWHHMVGTMDGANIRLYVDGILRATTAWPGGVIETPSLASLGLACSVEPIDLPMLWNRALSEAEISQLYREPFCMFQQDRPELYVAAAPPAGGEWVQVQIIAALPALLPLSMIFGLAWMMRKEREP